MNPPGGIAKRVLLAAGTQTYKHGEHFSDPLGDLDAVPAALTSVVDGLTGLGYTTHVEVSPKYLLDPSKDDLEDAVEAAARSAPIVVVYYTGHGVKPERSPYYLVTAESTPGKLRKTALEARQLSNLVVRRDAYGELAPDEEQPQVLVILDCCFSGTGGIEVLENALRGIGSPNLWLLASASSVEFAQQGRFAAARSQALMEPAVGLSQEFVGLDSITDTVNATLADTDQKARHFAPAGQSTGLSPFFPSPKHVVGVAGMTVSDQHWVSRLRGAPSQSATAGFYVAGRTGRVRIVEDLAAWMRAPDGNGLAVVTGSPGAGKSAMLALPVLLSDSESRESLLAQGDCSWLVARAAELFKGLPVCGLHVRGENPYQVTDMIAQHMGRRTAENPEELLDGLRDHPETSSLILVIDAVDEARDPRRLLTDLLLPLGRRPGMRVLIGVRQHIVPPRADTGLWVDLDSYRYSDPQALSDYATQLLVAAHEPDVSSPYRSVGEDITALVAAAIAAKATARPTAQGRAESFLLTQLVARAVRSRRHVIDTTSRDWAKDLPEDVGAAFDEDLQRLGTREPVARTLLAALAWARGAGLPWETIWVPLARALAAHLGTGATSLDNDDVRWLLDNAGAYIVEDEGAGKRSMFRPFHDLLAAHLRRQPSGQRLNEPTVADAWTQQRRQIETLITYVLTHSITGPDGTPDWQLAHPYLRTYLAQHAHAAGPDAIAELTADLDYLAIADPITLTPLLTPAVPTLRTAATVYRRVRPLLGDNARANAAYLQETSIAQTGSHPATQHVHPTYQTLMARVRRDDSLLTILTGHTGGVTAVAFGADADGHPLLATAGDDGTVRLWDPSTGAPIGDPLTGHAGPVTAVAFGADADGHPLLATAGDDGTVRLWDPSTGAPIGDPVTSHRGAVSALAFGADVDAQPLIASAGGFVEHETVDPAMGPLGRVTTISHEPVMLWHPITDARSPSGEPRRRWRSGSTPTAPPCWPLARAMTCGCGTLPLAHRSATPLPATQDPSRRWRSGPTPTATLCSPPPAATGTIRCGCGIQPPAR